MGPRPPWIGSVVLRFCLLTTFYPPWGFGGDAVHVRRLAHALAGRGHEVTVIHSREGFAALADAVPAPRDRDGPVRLVGVDAGWGALSPLVTHMTGRPLLARGSLTAALAEPFDVLHFHNPSLLGGPGLLGMGQGLRLYTLHEQWLVCPTHVLFRYRREVCPKPRCLTCQLSYRRPPQLWRGTRLLDPAVEGLDALIAPSLTSAALHERFASRVRIEHIPHFVPAPAPGPPHEHPRPYFLYAGRLEPVKGVESLVDAFRGRGEDLLVAGSGSLEDALRERAADLPNVRFLGSQPPDRLTALYRGARAVVAPSAGHEAFGLVPAEALACGTPVVVPDFGALGELGRTSGAGLLYRDRAGLTEALDRLAADDSLRDELGRRGIRAWEERWTEQRHLERYLALVADLSEGRRGAAAAVPGGASR